jgi:predicted phage tail protein
MEMSDKELISGAGSKGSNPVNAEDNLNSKATAKILDAISEGEIAGFATPFEEEHLFGSADYGIAGQKDIFFNKTPLLQPTASLSPTADDYNFNTEKLFLETKNGKGDQEIIKGFSQARTVVSAFPNDDLSDAGENRVLSFTDTDTARVSQVVVIVGIPALFAAFNSGDVTGSNLRYVISRSVSDINGGAFATPPGMSILVTGRTNDLFQQFHTINIPDATNTATRTIQIKVLKFNAQDTNSNIIQQGNSVKFMSIIKVIETDKETRKYNNTALVGLFIDAENFSSVPKRSYLVKGIQIKIPGAGANGSGTPDVDRKTGRIEYPTNYVFNGTMQAARFCACPVFVLYDILTNTRYGFGDQILTPLEKVAGGFSSGNAQNIDLFSFVEASKYANTLVSDRRTNPTSISGTYVQTGTRVVINFGTESKLQEGDLVSCDYTSGAATDRANTRVRKSRNNGISIRVAATDSASTSGNVTVTKGNTEPRFSFNGVINKQEDAFKLLNKVASVFRGAVYFSEGKIKITQDRPSDPVYLFNRSNVTQEGFSYEGSDIKTRTNCVVVRYFNNTSQQIDYVQHPVTATDVQNDPFVTKYGVNKKQVDAFACTSSGQASRLARFIYYSENFLTETCTFTTTSDAGVVVKPGMVISVSDPVRSGTRLAGRITAASTTQITVDSISGISFSSGDKLSVILGNGNMETKDVSGISGSVITVSSAFTSAPNVNSVWLYEKTTAVPSTWRIVTIEQAENLQYTITAITYNSSLYNTIEGGTDVEARDITDLDEKIAAPSALTIRESLYKHVPNKDTFATNNGNIRIQLRVGWEGVSGAVKYKVIYTKGADTGHEDNPVEVIVRRTEFELRNVDAGNEYTFKVQSINAGGLLSANSVTASRVVIGKSEPPSDVASLSATIDPNDGVGLNWVPVVPVQPNFADLDLAGYEVRKGTVWDNGTHPETGAASSGIRVQATNLFLPVEFVKATSTFMVKAYDTSGNFSTNATSTAVTINNPSVIQNAVTTAENGFIKIRWDAPATSTYKIKNYKITFNDGSAKTIFADSTEFQTPGAWVGSSRVFTIRAVNIAGNEGTSSDVTVTIPEPLAPTNLTHSFTTDSVVLKWTEAASAGALQPPVIGYRIYRNNGTDSIAQIKGTEFTLLVNDTNFPNVSGTAQASYQVAAVYADPAFPTDGRASSNQATRTISISVAPAPTPSFSFELDFVKVVWNEVNGSLPTIRYGIFEGSTLLGVADSREFTTKANFTTKTIQIKAFSAAYINAVGDAAAQALFIGTGSNFTITRQNLPAPTSGSFVLGSEGGLGFVTSKWTPPTVNPANHLDLKDFKIIRSSSSTFAGVTTGNTELSVIQDTESFKEEVSWKVTGQNDSISKYYYIVPRDLLNNEGTVLKIEVEIFRPGKVPASGTSEVIDNNVLLRWGEPAVNAANQLKIDHYELRKHEGSGASSQVWSTSSPIGKGSGETITDSRFSVLFETVAGTFTYLIKAYDTAGNESKDTPVFFVTLAVAQPPDFVLNADYDSVFSTSGTGLTSPSEIDSVAFTNCLKIFDFLLNKDVLYLPVLTNSSGVGTQTWSQHFIGTGSSSSPQFANITAAINAGFSDYLEPAPTGDSGKGEYQEVFDYGAQLASSRVSSLATFANQGSGTVNQSQRLDLASGGSGGTFSDGTESNSNAAQRFGVAFQRVRYKTSATSVAGSLTKITNLNLKIDVKIKNDTGTGTANASDSGGTTVNFNVTFVDVQGIAVTPNTTSAVIAVVDFQDVPNPTSFKVLLYNTSGVRVSGNFTWQCRGT